MRGYLLGATLFLAGCASTPPSAVSSQSSRPYAMLLFGDHGYDLDYLEADERTPPLTLGELPPNALKLLAAYGWPGNVRELRNVVERLVVTKSLEQLGQGPMALKPWHEARGDVIAKFEQEYVQRALLQANGNLAAAARTLGVSRQLVHQIVTRYGLEHD